jgi:hypothetical protein
MALAEAGRFDDAVVWQQRAIERQIATGADPAPGRQRLALYQARRPAREPSSQPVAAARASAPRANDLPPR